MSRLLACPFCRELFDAREAARCPDCELDLVPMERLPPSADALADRQPQPYVPPEHRTFGLWFWRRGRGALALLSLCGLSLFFAPWVRLTHGDTITLRGFDLARGNAAWLWGGAVAWFLLIPLVASRRTAAALRGMRVVATAFAFVTLIEVVSLLARPPAEHRYFSYAPVYAWGFYASGLVSLLGLLVGARLGGPRDDLRDLPPDDSNDGDHQLH